MTGTGAIDFATREASLSMRGSNNGEPIVTDVRVVGGMEYTRNGGDWHRAAASATNLDAPNPASYLSYLQGVSSDVRVEGHETLRGVDTIRYRADIDFDRALTHPTNPAETTAFAQARRLLGGMHMPTTVWVDADGHLRKTQFALDLGTALRKAGLPVTGDPRMSISLELYDFGVPVHVVAPAGATGAAAIAQMRATQSDLRNALVAEKVLFTDNQMYSADTAVMKQIESALDWGGKLKVVVGNTSTSRGWVVCLSETSATGQVFSIADVAGGSNAGTYHGRSACPASVDGAAMARLGSRW